MGVIHDMDNQMASLNKTAVAVQSTGNYHRNQAKEWSESLMHIVDNAKDSNGKPVMYQYLSGTKFLKVEAWEMIGKFAGVSAETDEIWELRDKQGNVNGYRVKVILVDKNTGQRVGGGAIMQCGIDENVAKGQHTQGGKESACLSMAQTRATSKAFRMNYSFVAVLGGYSALPQEELTDDMQAGGPTLVEYAQQQGAQVIENTPKPIVEVPVENNCALMDCNSDTGEKHTKKTNKTGGVFWSHQWEGKWCAANEWNEDFPKDDIAGAWAARAEDAKGPQGSSYLYETCTGQPIGKWLSTMAEILA